MEIKELRGKSKNELIDLLREVRGELVSLHAERKTGSLTDGSAITKKREELARISTVLREKEILRGVGRAVEASKEKHAKKKI